MGKIQYFGLLIMKKNTKLQYTAPCLQSNGFFFIKEGSSRIFLPFCLKPWVRQVQHNHPYLSSLLKKSFSVSLLHKITRSFYLWWGKTNLFYAPKTDHTLCYTMFLTSAWGERINLDKKAWRKSLLPPITGRLSIFFAR